MIYGANGYTGELIAREAVRRGERPILAGRSGDKIVPLAKELGLDARIFDLDRIDLHDVDLVLHCAGPFTRTAKPMVRACLEARAHYLDITGELNVFEAVLARDADAKARGITLLPGVGFDVVPTDCLAAKLKERMPDATELWLAFYSRGGSISRGTMKTMIEHSGKGGAIRKDGAIARVPVAYDVREIPFDVGPRLAMTIPWGDVATAYRTTGIPNIRVYSVSHPKSIRRMRRFRPFMPLLNLGIVKKLANRIADKRTGPSAEQREKASTHLWGRVANAAGEEFTMTMTVAEGYKFTVLAAVESVMRIRREPVRAGATTPALRFGSSYVDDIERLAVSG
jgi:short subunit dehydrogenase-like uncharacterized protein